MLFQDSLNTLKLAKSKYAGSKEALEQFKPNWNENVTLVPLTGSMYVPGKFKEVDNVLIDIGTGYYVEMVSSLYIHIYKIRGNVVLFMYVRILREQGIISSGVLILLPSKWTKLRNLALKSPGLEMQFSR